MKLYRVNGKLIKVPNEISAQFNEKHPDAEFVQDVKQKQDPNKGKTQEPKVSAAAVPSTPAPDQQEVTQPSANQQPAVQQNNQQEKNTESESEDGSLESVDKTINSFRAFKPKKERLIEIQSEAQVQIDLLSQTSQTELPPKNITQNVSFASKHSQIPTISSSPSIEYQQAKNNKDKSIKDLNSLKQEATVNILRSNYSSTGEKLEPGTKKYEDFVRNIPQDALNTEMLKVKSKSLEQQDFEDNFEETMEELSLIENFRGGPLDLLKAGVKKSSYQKDLEKESSKAASELNAEIKNNVKRSKQFISNLEGISPKFDNLKTLQEKLLDINNQASKINSAEYKTQEEVDNANKQLSSLRSQFDKLNVDYDNNGGLTYEELIDVRDKNLKGFNKTQQEGSGLVKKEEELAGYLDAVGRNYGWAANLGGTLAHGVMSLASTSLEVAQKIIDIPKELNMPEWIMPFVMSPTGAALSNVSGLTRQGIDAIDKVNEDLLNGLEKPGEFKDIGDAEEFGEWFGHLVTSQAANTAITFTTGGASLFILGASSAGQKFKDIDREERDTGKNYTFAQKYSTAFLTGIAEGLSETVTLGQANKVKALLKGNVAMRRGFANTMKRNFFTRKGLYQNLYDPIEEGGTEVLAQLSSNALDYYFLEKKDKSLLEGVSESFISGVFMSGLVYKSPLIGKNVVKAFQSSDATVELQGLSEKIQNKSRILNEVELSPENRKAIESEIGTLVGQHSQLMDESISNIDKMTAAEKRSLIDVDVTVAALRANNKSIKGEFGLTQEQIDSQVKDNNIQIANLTALKNQTIANANKSENLNNIERDTADLERTATKMFGKPISVVKVNDKNISEQLDVYKKAEIKAVDNKIKNKKEELKTADKESKVEIEGQIKQLEADKLGVKKLTEQTFKGSHGASAIHADMILVNPEFAAERGATNVIQHEMMHQLLKNTLADNPRAAIALGNAVDDILSGLDPDAVAQSEMSSRLTAYISKPESVRAEEKVTLLMDALKSGDIKINTSLGSKLKAPIRRILQASGMQNVKLNTAEDVLNFITDMNAKSNIFGKNKAFTQASLEGLKIGKELTAGVTVESTDTTIEPKESRNAEASALVQKIYEEQGESGAFDIIDQFKPIVNKIVEKRREAPNFDKQLLTDEIETGKRGLFDLIREYKIESGVPLAAYINKYLPARAIEASKRVLGEEFTDDVTEAKGVTATDTAEDTMTKEAKPKRKGIVLADRLKVKEQVAPAAEKYVKDNDLTGTTYKKTPNITTETVGELMSIPSKKITSNANLSKPELANAQMFIAKNADMLQSMLPEGATEDGTATGVQKVLLDQFYNKKSKRSKTKAGLATQSKKPNITRTEFLEVFGIVDGKPQRDDRNTSSRVLALAKQLDRAMSNQAIREVLMQDDKQAATVQDMASGKSPVMFSKDAQDLLTKAGRTIREQFDLEFNGADKLIKNSIGDRTYKFDSKEDIDSYFKDVRRVLVSIFPKGFISPSFLRPSNRILPLKGKKIINVDGVDMTVDDYFTQQRDDMFSEDLNYGPSFTGAAKNFVARTYGKVFGNSAAEFDKAKKDGTIDKFNKENGAMHKQMWQRINDSIKADKNNAKVIGNFFKITSQKANHPHRLGAEFIGWSPKAKGSRGKKYEWEHAMPATSAYLYLLDASLNDLDFDQAYDLVMKNYKLIALDAAMDDKLKVAGLTTSMPTDFNMLNNVWWERYFNKDVAKVNGGIDPNSIVLTNGKTLGEDLNIKSDGNLAIVKASNEEIQSKINLLNARQSLDANPRGMSTFDFDETLIIGGENFVLATDPSTSEQVKITSEDWPIKGPDYAAQGYEFDFSDFANVRGGKEGPLLQKMKNQIKKYGNKNVFVLTARMQNAAGPIQQWLKTKGISIPLRNITGLGKSEGEAKGQWMLQKFAEGYNDMYFVDDALPNVKAVRDVLDQLDIKSKVVQAKIKFSKDGSTEFNNMLERTSGIPADKIFSEASARLRGQKSNSFKFFVPASAEDFKGLLYNFLGRGKQGDADMQFFKEHLLDPFTKGTRDINYAKQRTSEEFKALRKEMPTVFKSLSSKVPGTDFTINDAVRVYLWNKNGIDIPGVSDQEISLLSDYVTNDSKTKAFADTLSTISRAKEGYTTPDENWIVGSITSDLFDQTGKINRAEHLTEWKNNIDLIFSPENLNKIQAIYGNDFKNALENMLFRMQTGSNRAQGDDKIVNSFMDWINGSVGAVMFFNTRSAALQTLSTVNFLNWNDNNIFQAAKAFANQPQYWKDFITLFNSDMLKQRRSGMSIDVNLSELSNTVAKSSMKDKSKAAIRYLLQIGFTPTQIADSFAIASGGATFYRNKVKKYLKEGVSQKEAESKAFDDFQEIAEETQQSSRPDLISQQQAGTLGRLILAWQNTPMQYTRLTKKAISDLVNGRGDWKSHVSRILYYGAVQNVIFGSLQTGLAFLLFGGEEEEEKTNLKATRVANGALDTLLRGTGVYGAMVSTLKNTIMKYVEESGKGYGKRELSKVALEAVQLSPPIGSKLRKIMSAIYSYEYNKGVPEKMGLSIDNPILNVIGNLVEALTNAPLARAVKKAQQIEEAINGNHELWKRVALIMGWDKWSLDVKDADVEQAKVEVKEDRANKKAKENKLKKEKKKKEEQVKKEESGLKSVRCSGVKSSGKRCSIMVDTKAKTAKCSYHKTYKKGEASDSDNDGIKEYRCTATTGSGSRCKNRTENSSKKCYAHV